MKITRSELKTLIMETKGFTPAYDDDESLAGGQKKNLPDALQKGIIDAKVDESEENEIEESKMKITRTQLKNLIREELLSEITDDSWVWSDNDFLLDRDD